MTGPSECHPSQGRNQPSTSAACAKAQAWSPRSPETDAGHNDPATSAAGAASSDIAAYTDQFHRRTLADLEAALDPRDVSAARQLGTPEHLPLTRQAQSVLTALYRTDRPVAA